MPPLSYAAATDKSPIVDSKPNITPSEAEDEYSASEFVISHFISHGMASDPSPLYRVQRYDYGTEDGTKEPISHFPRSHILRYYRQ